MSKRTNFRNRKISIKQALAILRASDIDELDEDLLLQNAAQVIESGVDKEEENETHLVAAMSSTHTKPVYIPTPDASRVVAGYEKQFRKPYSMPSSFIRFSATVEDCEGCPYSMDEQDSNWLTKFNAGRKENTQISEDAFEWIMQQFEMTINTKQPFLATAPDSILPFEELESSFSEETSVAGPHKAFAKFVYSHWRARRVGNGGKPIMPLLRYEENAKDDGDPYVCFRRREVRQIRKTRQTGQSATVRLRSLRGEMDQVRNLTELVLRREQLKREALLADQAVFEKRCHVKELKRKLGIKGEDEDLINHKRRKSIEQTPQTVQRPVRPLLRQEGDSNLTSLEDYFEERALKTKDSVNAAVATNKLDTFGWCDFTDDTYLPLHVSTPTSFFRTIRTYYTNENGLIQYSTGKGQGKGKSSRAQFRKRMGRGGRIIIDRRRIRTEVNHKPTRWDFDCESEDEAIDINAL